MDTKSVTFDVSTSPRLDLPQQSDQWLFVPHSMGTEFQHMDLLLNLASKKPANSNGAVGYRFTGILRVGPPPGIDGLGHEASVGAIARTQKERIASIEVEMPCEIASHVQAAAVPKEFHYCESGQFIA
jgi:hypothetical protein